MSHQVPFPRRQKMKSNSPKREEWLMVTSLWQWEQRMCPGRVGLSKGICLVVKWEQELARCLGYETNAMNLASEPHAAGETERELSGELENRSQPCDVWLDQHQFKDIWERCPESCERSMGAGKKKVHKGTLFPIPKTGGWDAQLAQCPTRADEMRLGQDSLQFSYTWPTCASRGFLELFCSVVL